MPKSTPPRKRGHDAQRTKAQRRVENVIDGAQQLDRRRQAQITNQAASITRLLARFEADPETAARAVYSREMHILHEGAAVLMVERDDARMALRQLVEGLDREAHSLGIASELARARAVLSASVTSAMGVPR